MTDLRQLTVVNQIGFATQFFHAIMTVEIAAVGQTVEIIAAFCAVGVSNILKKAQSVQRPVLDHLIVRDHHGFSQTQTLTVALHILEAGLAFPLRMDVNHVGGVHGSGADAHEDTVEVLQQLTKLNLLEKVQLGRYMTACQNDKVSVLHQFSRFVLCAAIKENIFAEGDAAFLVVCLHVVGVLFGQFHIIGGRSDKQRLTIGVQGFQQFGGHTVLWVHGAVVTAGTAGQEIGHHQNLSFSCFS